MQKIVEFKEFSRLLSDFPVLFKTDLIFKDFSRKPSKFKYFLSLCEPCYRIKEDPIKSEGTRAVTTLSISFKMLKGS